MRSFLIYLISLYKRFISPNIKPCCRFIPTCSEYASQAIREHGSFKGLILTTLRLLRCNPLFRGGYDPVPPAGK